MFILFFSFAKIDFRLLRPQKKHFLILFLNITIPFIAYFSLNSYNHEYALIAFMIAITPTATASPIVMKHLNSSVEFMIGSVIINNIAVTFIISFALSIVIGGNYNIDTASIISQISFTLFLPLILALIAIKSIPKFTKVMRKFKRTSFLLWVTAIFLVTSKSSHYIQSSNIPVEKLIWPALIALVLCAIQFSLGSLIGGKKLYYEASHALGQKNTILTIWICLHWLNPYIGLGGVFYVIWQNIFISYRLAKNPN